MKIKHATIPAGSLINKYLPADYSDVFGCETASEYLPTPDDITINLFTEMPGWINVLFKVRNFIVQLVGLKGGGRNNEKLNECIRSAGKYEFLSVSDKSEDETVVLLEDKHLNAYLSIHIADIEHHKQNVSLITVVHFNNMLGNVYLIIYINENNKENRVDIFRNIAEHIPSTVCNCVGKQSRKTESVDR